jgi:hypothetical protein
VIPTRRSLVIIWVIFHSGIINYLGDISFAVGQCGCIMNLVGISNGEINYLVSSILLLFCPALSAAIRGQDWMDGGKAIWM